MPTQSCPTRRDGWLSVVPSRVTARALFTTLTLCGLVLTACRSIPFAPVPVSGDDTFSLQILHSADNESALQDPNTLEPKILPYAAIVAGLRELAPNDGAHTIHVTAGDHTLPGPFYQAAAAVPELGAPGLGDIALFNAMQLTANGMGNHEFDGGIDDFARMLDRADYPFIAVNLDFTNVELAENTPPIEIGVDGGSVTENAGKVVKSAYVAVGGEKIGLIGRAPADFFNVIADPDATMPGLDFVGGRHPETNQPSVSAVEQVLEQVDRLESQGINKIILLDHAQDFTINPLAARFLRGIDVIVAAGSTGFMARPDAQGPFNRLREDDDASADYPTMRRDREGNFVAVVNSDQLYRYVGHLLVTFNNAGHIIHIDPRSGPVATTPQAVDALAEIVGHELAPPPTVAQTFQALRDTAQIQEQFQVIGTTATPLNGERTAVRSRETNLGRLAADATLWYARQQFPDLGVDIALKNGGGIRASIAGPNITQFMIGTTLAFDNGLAVVELSGDELLAAMENAVSRVPALDGRFPQVAGLYLEYDTSRPGISDQTSIGEPSRVKTLRITRAEGAEDTLVEDFAAQGDLSRTFTLATNDFLLTGGDGYQVLNAAAEARGAQRPPLGERQILADYIAQVLDGTVDRPEPLVDPRVVRSGIVQNGAEQADAPRDGTEPDGPAETTAPEDASEEVVGRQDIYEGEALVLMPGEEPIGSPDGQFNREAALGIYNQRVDKTTAITSGNVAQLTTTWQIPLNDLVSHTPIVADDRLYFADWGGVVYAADAQTGELLWQNALEIPQRTYPWHGFAGTGTLAEGLLIQASVEGNAFALDQETGDLVWQTRIAAQEHAGNLSDLLYYDGLVYIGLQSPSEGLDAGDPEFEPTFRGNVVALDVTSGEIAWRQYLVEPPQNGASVWSSFGLDPELGLLYFTTSNNYTGAASTTSDALIAVDAKTGSIAWTQQVMQHDVWTPVEPVGADYGFGGGAQLFEAQSDGEVRKLVGAGQKSGIFFVFDRATGEEVWATFIGYGQVGGGIRGEGSVGDGRIYLWSNNSYVDGQPPQESLMTIKALDAATGRDLWFYPNAQPAGGTSGGFLSNDVFFVGSLEGTIHAYHASTGDVLWRGRVPGSVASSITVVNDMLYVGTGVPRTFGGDAQPNGVFAFRLE